MRDAATGEVIGSVLETDARRTAERLDALPDGCNLVEIRADHLRASDVAGLVERVRNSGREAIVTARRPEDGGGFDGSEAERRGLLEGALAAGARYVDVELGLPLAELAEGEQAPRVILSHHGAPCVATSLRVIRERLESSRAARLKLVPLATAPAEVLAVRELLRDAGPGRRLAAFAMGRAGALSRLLALAWGGWATYGAAAPGAATAPGQFSARDLLDVYDVRRIGPATALHALIGTRVFGSPSPAMHAAGYRRAGLDARYLPLELDGLEPAARLVEALPLGGLAVTMPFKGQVALRCAALEPLAARAKAVNTVVVGGEGWSGYTTDGPAAVACVRRHVDPAARVALLGAGGSARAIAAALRAAGATVTIYARDPAKAQAAAKGIDARVERWEQAASATWDVLVHATPLGTAGESPLPAAALTGRLVLDAVYGRSATPLVQAARERGLATVDGFELLVEQAVLQFERLTGAAPERDVLAGAGRRWLDANAP